MSKESRLKNILLATTSSIGGAIIGGTFAYFMFTKEVVDLSQMQYTTIGALAGGMLGAYMYYSRLENLSSNKKK